MVGDKVSVETTALFRRLLPDELWALLDPLIPRGRPRPQGGGRARVSDRRVAFAVIYVVTSGCAWRRLPDYFGVAVPTAYRRHMDWIAAGVWTRLLAHVAQRPVTDRTWIREVAQAALDRYATDNGRFSVPTIGAATDHNQPVRGGAECHLDTPWNDPLSQI